MKILEYGAKEVLRQHRIPTPDGGVAASPQEARAVAERVGGLHGELVRAGHVGHEGGPKLEHELKEYVKQTLAPYKYPRRVEFLAELPKNERGKVVLRGDAVGVTLREPGAE